MGPSSRSDRPDPGLPPGGGGWRRAALALALGLGLPTVAPAQVPSPMSPVPGMNPAAMGQNGYVPSPMPASGGQVLRFAVAVPSGPAWSSIWLELERLGQSTAIGLVDDGSSPEDIPLDGVYVGSQSGPYARYVTLRVFGRTPEGNEAMLWEGSIATSDQWQETIAFRISALPDGPRAERVAVALPAGQSGFAEGMPVLVAFGWGTFLLVFVGLLGVGRVRRGLA